MTRPTPRSTLFPYTTLFRSSAIDAKLVKAASLTHLRTGLTIGSHTGDGIAALDRKSTRLNSSHLVISYAVFCLKKKKTRNNLACDNYTNTHSFLSVMKLSFQ